MPNIDIEIIEFQRRWGLAKGPAVQIHYGEIQSQAGQCVWGVATPNIHLFCPPFCPPQMDWHLSVGSGK